MLVYDRPLKIRLHQSGWVGHLRFDASVVVDGLTWLRVAGGFGSDRRHPREDWVAAVPAMSISVSKYRDEKWRSHVGIEHDTREEAMRAEREWAMPWATYRIDETSRKLRAQTHALELLRGEAA